VEGDVLSRDAMTARLTGAVRRHPQLTNAASPSQAVRLDPDTRVRLKRVSDVEKACPSPKPDAAAKWLISRL
jgi:hypothetical protein